MCSYGSRSASRTFFTPSSWAAASATARQALPATSTCTSPASDFAAVSALWVASLSTLLSCSARRSVLMQWQPSNDAHLVLQLIHEFAHALHLHSGLAPGRLRGLEHFQTR